MRLCAAGYWTNPVLVDRCQSWWQVKDAVVDLEEGGKCKCEMYWRACRHSRSNKLCRGRMRVSPMTSVDSADRMLMRAPSMRGETRCRQ